MAIVKMDHFKLYSMNSDTEKMLTLLQDFGDVHITNITEEEEYLESGLTYVSEPKFIIDIRNEISEIEDVIELLSSYEEDLGAIQSMKKGMKNYTYEELMELGPKIDVSNICKNMESLRQSREEKENKIAQEEGKLKELLPWRNLKLSSKDLESTNNVSFITGYVLSKQYDSMKKEIDKLNYTHIELVGMSDSDSYVLIISEKEDKNELTEILRKYSFFREDIKVEESPNDEIKKIRKNILKLKDQVDNIGKTLKREGIELDDLKLRYEYLNQLLVKYESTNNFLSTKFVNLIEGYLKSSDSEKFKGILENRFADDYYLEIQAADKNDINTPILLENNKLVQPFENLTEMYSMPRYNEIDPTPFLAPFYWLFFGMMIGDFGYGMLMVLATWVMMRFNVTDSMRNNLKFFNLLGFSAIFWGLLYGSFFGGVIDIPGLIDPAVDYKLVMILSLGLGGIHMFMGLGLKAYMLIRDGKKLDALYDVFTWYLTLISAIYFGISKVMGLPGSNVAKYLMFIGMAAIVLLTGRAAKTWPGRIASGAYELYGISSWMGDFVSYVRLMALGLAGGFIGVAINLIVETITGVGGVAGIVFAVIVFTGGQLFNLGLSALSAYVHTMRLTFVEFMGKFYEGGGKSFNKVRSNSKYINIRKQED